MPSAAEESENLAANGLVGFSYDHLWAIRRRVRKIGDLVIPLRGGLTYAQLGTGFATLVVMFFLYAITGLPLSTALHLSPTGTLVLMALYLVVPPVLVAQRMVAPMPNGKTLGGFIRSISRYYFDDKVYRRGRPIDTPKTHRPGRQRHDLVVWEPGEQFAEEFNVDVPLSRPEVERRFTGAVIDLATAQQEVSRQHLSEELAAAEREQSRSREEEYTLRHSDASGVTGL